MRIHRLIIIVLALGALTATALTTIQPSSVGARPDAAAQEPAITAETVPAVGDGFSSVAEAETSVNQDVDLFLDAAEVERRALEEQNGSASASASSAPIPVSFKHVAIPIQGGVDHAVAGVATRNSGQGVIRLRGIPPGSTLLSAVLVWGEIAAPPALNPYNVGFGPDCAPGAVVPGTPAPFPTNPAANPCWNPAGQFFAYIANVTGQIVPGINGDYRVRGLRSALVNNRCPWADSACAGPGNALVLSEGASLIVFYSNPCIPRAAQLYVSLGPRMFFGPHSVIHATVPPINGNLPNLKHSRIGADGQVGVANCGLRAFPAASDERTFIENPAMLTSIQIKGDGGGLNRDSDWNGYDGEPLNKLWDTHTDVFASGGFLAAGGGLSYRVRYVSQGDCIVWVVHILGVR
ncbi:MAG TPA: hypothetical protein VKA70_20050 [Blastocatellia bacterium]|nr:hypothetical protein [Blastocatellia bacterium]